MPFVSKNQTFHTNIFAVTFGTGETAVTLGGQNVLPFYTFDAPIENPPKIGIELSDGGMELCTTEGLKAFYDGCDTVVQMAQRAQTAPGVSFLTLHFEGADPNGKNRSAAWCADLAGQVAAAVTLPIAVMGCGNADKDTELFKAVAERLSGKNVLFLSACEENYKALCEKIPAEHTLSAESAVDINLAKQLNIVLLQQGWCGEKLVMNAGSAAVGYGFDYVASTIERIRLAALQQSDAQLRMPIVTPVSTEVWGVKEVTASEADMPQWGDREERAIGMETATASACLACGSDAVILRHPASIEAVSAMIGALM